MNPLTERDLDTLGELRSACDSNAKHHTQTPYSLGYAKSMDCGGGDCTHHSATLTKLAKRGLAEVWEQRTKQPWRSRYAGNKFYRITQAGRDLLPAPATRIR